MVLAVGRIDFGAIGEGVVDVALLASGEEAGPPAGPVDGHGGVAPRAAVAAGW